MSNRPTPGDDEYRRLCRAAVRDVCNDADRHVSAAQEPGRSGMYVRALYTIRGGRAVQVRIVYYSIGDLGTPLQRLLCTRLAHCDPRTSAPCWLTLQTEDGVILEHALFGLTVGSRVPQQETLDTDLHAMSAQEPGPGGPSISHGRKNVPATTRLWGPFEAKNVYLPSSSRHVADTQLTAENIHVHATTPCDSIGAKRSPPRRGHMESHASAHPFPTIKAAAAVVAHEQQSHRGSSDSSAKLTRLNTLPSPMRRTSSAHSHSMSCNLHNPPTVPQSCGSHGGRRSSMSQGGHGGATSSSAFHLPLLQLSAPHKRSPGDDPPVRPNASSRPQSTIFSHWTADDTPCLSDPHGPGSQCGVGARGGYLEPHREEFWRLAGASMTHLFAIDI